MPGVAQPSGIHATVLALYRVVRNVPLEGVFEKCQFQENNAAEVNEREIFYGKTATVTLIYLFGDRMHFSVYAVVHCRRLAFEVCLDFVWHHKHRNG